MKYRQKISGPIMDRIDIQKYVRPVDFMDLSNDNKGASSESLRQRVETARKIQQQRFAKMKGINCNSQMGNQDKALSMLPFHSEIKIYALSQAQSEDAIEYWSDAILAQNKTIALAYEGKAAVAASRNEYDQMSANIDDKPNLELTENQQVYLLNLEEVVNRIKKEDATPAN